MPALAENARQLNQVSQCTELHTHGHVNCPACDNVRRLMIEPRALAVLRFPEAAELWLKAHRRSIRPGSIRDYETCIRQLALFFGELELQQIHIGHFEQYQAMRQEGSGGLRRAGNSRINHELNTLSQILARANLWATIQPYYKPLPLPRPKVGCALNEDQEKTLFATAASKPRWRVAYLCSLCTANTTAGPGEIRMLRLMDVNLSPQPPGAPFGQIKIVEGAKNEYRVRPIPLNRTARWAFSELLNRAHDLGAILPEHYLLPHRARHGNGKRRGDFDPTRPQSSWRKAWDKLRVAAGMPHLRMYDLRHHVITKLLEDETISERTVIELAGQISTQMLNTYSHIRMRRKIEAVLCLDEEGFGYEMPLPAEMKREPGYGYNMPKNNEKKPSVSEIGVTKLTSVTLP